MATTPLLGMTPGMTLLGLGVGMMVVVILPPVTRTATMDVAVVGSS